MIYHIYEEQLERLNKKLARIANKCAKFGCDFRYEEVGEEFVPVYEGLVQVGTARVVLVEVSGTAIINGWKFVAELSRVNGGNVITGVADIEVPERFRECSPECEHCNTRRARKSTFVVLNEESGEWKQVGRSCLNDFTHGLSAEAYAGFLDGIKELEAYDGVPCGSGFRRYYNTREYLAYAFEAVRCYGYVPASEMDSTSNKTGCYYAVANGYRFIGDEFTRAEMSKNGVNAEKQQETVERALEWIGECAVDSNYIHNLKLLCAGDYFPAKNAGIVASLTVAYNRHVESAKRKELVDRERRAEAVKSDYVGEVGKRITISVESCAVVTGWYTQFGYTYIYKIVDTNGNVYTWKTTRCLQNDDGECKVSVVIGTVKGHRDYNGVAQTELTRCKVTHAA